MSNSTAVLNSCEPDYVDVKVSRLTEQLQNEFRYIQFYSQQPQEVSVEHRKSMKKKKLLTLVELPKKLSHYTDKVSSSMENSIFTLATTSSMRRMQELILHNKQQHWVENIESI